MFQLKCPISDDRPKRDSMPIEEATVSIQDCGEAEVTSLRLLKKRIAAGFCISAIAVFSGCVTIHPEPQEFGASFPGHLVALLDGDKVDISYHDTEDSVPLRLYGIDAPEQGQPYWQEAKDFLGQLLNGKTVKVLGGPYSHGGEERLIATVILPDRTTANRALIKAGLAWVYEQDFADDMEPDRKDELMALEQEARVAKKGLWADPAPIPPWVYRKAR